MMRGAGNSADENQDRGKIGHAQGRFRIDQSQGDQKQRNHGHAKELKNAFHPDMDHVPAPVIGDGQVSAAAVKQAEAEKHHNQNSAKHVKNGQRSAVPGFFVFVLAAI